jgi:hypothetical protein
MAEQRTGSGARAFDVEVENDGSSVVYEIELVSTSGSHEVKVDAKVRSSSDGIDGVPPAIDRRRSTPSRPGGATRQSA